MGKRTYPIGVTLLTVLISIIGCKKDSSFRTEVVVRNPSLNRFTNDFDAQIKTTTEFLSLFVDSYRGTIKSSVKEEFYERFPFLLTNLDSRVLFSELSETVLWIYPSQTNLLTVDCAHLPVQLLLFSGLETDPNARLLVNEEDFLKIYKTQTGLVVLRERAVTFLKKLTYVSNMPKLATVPTNSILLVQDIEMTVTNPLGSRTLTIDTLGILAGASDFGPTLSLATRVGKVYAEFPMIELFISSEFFRASLAHPELKSIAEQILKRTDRRKSGEEDYAYWQFLSDKNRLVETAKRWGLSEAYSEDFFRDYQSIQVGGTLFWKFASFKGFSFQWTLFNCLVFAASFYLFKKRQSKKWFWGTQLTLIVATGGNAWVFSQKPVAMGLKHWILPGLMFLVAFLPLWFKRHEYAAKRKLNAS